MSAATKRKHVVNQLVGEFPPLPSPPQLFVARIVAGRGNNLHLVEAALGEPQQDVAPVLPQFLVSMPVKFRKSFWVKRGDYILCSPIDEGDKVKAEIVRVLYKDDVNYIRDQKHWPREFDIPQGEEAGESDDMFPSSDDSSEEENDENATRSYKLPAVDDAKPEDAVRSE